MIQLKPFAELGGADHGWLKAKHHFSFASYYDPETEAGIAWDDPDVAVEWPLADPQVSERDRSAPRLAEIAAELPF